MRYLNSHKEMAQAMRKVAQMDMGLSVEERNLFSIAYKHLIAVAWKSTAPIEGTANTTNKSTFNEHKAKVETRLNLICNEILHTLVNHLIPFSEGESKVFFLKLKGDYHRYLAEYGLGALKESAVQSACEAYEEASLLAKHIPATHLTRLGLALNYSLLCYEMINNAEKACKLAQNAFDDAFALLDTLSEDAYKDATLIMQLLRDYQTLWTSYQTTESDVNLINLYKRKGTSSQNPRIKYPSMSSFSSQSQLHH